MPRNTRGSHVYKLLELLFFIWAVIEMGKFMWGVILDN